MKRLLTYFCLLLLLLSCKRGTYQVIELRNSSLEAVYFLLSEDKILSNPNDIAKIRPATSLPISKIKDSDIEYEDMDTEERIKQNLYRYRIERGSTETLLTSESAGIFVNAISVESIIKDRYKNDLHIFLISESDLQKNSDQEIIDQKLYYYFKSLNAEDIKESTLTFIYD